jgi:hypothetical protein
MAAIWFVAGGPKSSGQRELCHVCPNSDSDRCGITGRGTHAWIVSGRWISCAGQHASSYQSREGRGLYSRRRRLFACRKCAHHRPHQFLTPHTCVRPIPMITLTSTARFYMRQPTRYVHTKPPAARALIIWDKGALLALFSI